LIFEPQSQTIMEYPFRYLCLTKAGVWCK